jgi:hypothetical protein
MKIVRNTKDQLILTSVPWIIAIVFLCALLGMLAFGISGLFDGDWLKAMGGLIGFPAFLALFIVAFVRRDDLILDRTRNLVELRHSTFLGRTRVKHTLGDLGKAELQSSSSDGDTTYRIALVLETGMDQGTHPVTPVYSNDKGAQRGVAAINAWLAAHKSTR